MHQCFVELDLLFMTGSLVQPVLVPIIVKYQDGVDELQYAKLLHRLQTTLPCQPVQAMTKQVMSVAQVNLVFLRRLIPPLESQLKQSLEESQ